MEIFFKTRKSGKNFINNNIKIKAGISMQNRMELSDFKNFAKKLKWDIDFSKK